MLSGSSRWAQRAGSTGTVEQWGHHWVHKPRSGPRGLAWVVKCRLLPLALETWRENQAFKCCKSSFSRNLHHLWGSMYGIQTQENDKHMTLPDLKMTENFSHHYLTALWGRRTPGAITQADGGTKPPQLEATVTTESDACPRVMKQTLCGSMGGHWRPVASHHWVEIQACTFYSWTQVVLFSCFLNWMLHLPNWGVYRGFRRHF